MNHRMERVCEVLKRELGALILREISFPVALVTVSGVDVTPDLKQAHVFISAFGTPAQQRKVIALLEHNRAMLQQQLIKRVTFKNTPHLNFRLDESIERGTRVLTIMEELESGEEK